MRCAFADKIGFHALSSPYLATTQLFLGFSASVADFHFSRRYPADFAASFDSKPRFVREKFLSSFHGEFFLRSSLFLAGRFSRRRILSLSFLPLAASAPLALQLVMISLYAFLLAADILYRAMYDKMPAFLCSKMFLYVDSHRGRHASRHSRFRFAHDGRFRPPSGALLKITISSAAGPPASSCSRPTTISSLCRCFQALPIFHTGRSFTPALPRGSLLDQPAA